MRKLVLAGLTVVGAALPATCQEFEIDPFWIQYTRDLSRHSYAKRMPDQKIYDDLYETCYELSRGATKDSLWDIHKIYARSAYQYDQQLDYYSSIHTVAMNRACPQFVKEEGLKN